MAASENLSPHQFNSEVMHRGLGAYNDRTYDNKPYKSAEEWHEDQKDSYSEHVGSWWSADRKTAEFYGDSGKTDGLIVSARFPTANIDRAPGDEGGRLTGNYVPPGTPGLVHQVRARTSEGTWRDLPFTPGFTIKA